MTCAGGWPRKRGEVLLVHLAMFLNLLILCYFLTVDVVVAMSGKEQLEWKEKVREMFYHGFDK